MNFSNRETRLFLAVAVLSGLFFMFLANESVVLSILTLFSGEDFPRQGVVFFDMGDNSCEHYTLDKYLPAGKDQILQQNSEECPFIWNATLKMEKLEAINRSTEDPEINQLIKNASEAFDDRNWSEVDRIVDRLEVEREFSVKN